MSKRTALVLVFAAILLSTVGGLFGLKALGANKGILSLGFLVPLMLGAHVSSRVVMHYGVSERERR
ncbi:MAG: hypothetical protein WBL45_05880 [Solirubrobacterales bacterium]